MERADCFGGAGTRRMVDWIFEIGYLRLGEDSGGADDAVGDEGLLAAGFVGIEAVVADGLFRCVKASYAQRLFLMLS